MLNPLDSCSLIIDARSICSLLKFVSGVIQQILEFLNMYSGGRTRNLGANPNEFEVAFEKDSPSADYERMQNKIRQEPDRSGRPDPNELIKPRW